MRCHIGQVLGHLLLFKFDVNLMFITGGRKQRSVRKDDCISTQEQEA